MAREFSTPEEFFSALDNQVRLVGQYARSEKLDRALAVMPVSVLRENAHSAFVAQSTTQTSSTAANTSAAAPSAAAASDQSTSAATANRDVLSEQECLMLELLRWFKEEFFTWFDQPQACGSCGSTEFGKGVGQPTQQELMCVALYFTLQLFHQSITINFFLFTVSLHNSYCICALYLLVLILLYVNQNGFSAL